MMGGLGVFMVENSTAVNKSDSWGRIDKDQCMPFQGMSVWVDDNKVTPFYTVAETGNCPASPADKENRDEESVRIPRPFGLNKLILQSIGNNVEVRKFVSTV